MKKNIKILLVFLLVVLGMTSCVSRRKNYYTPSDERFKKIIEALESKDSEGLKAMFSVTALKEAEDIDIGIQYIMDLYKGELKSILSNHPGAQASHSYGTITYEMVSGIYEFKTSEDTYKLIFGDITVDSDPDNIGLTRIVFFREEDKELFYGGDTKTGKGVHCFTKEIEE